MSSPFRSPGRTRNRRSPESGAVARGVPDGSSRTAPSPTCVVRREGGWAGRSGRGAFAASRGEAPSPGFVALRPRCDDGAGDGTGGGLGIRRPSRLGATLPRIGETAPVIEPIVVFSWESGVGDEDGGGETAAGAELGAGTEAGGRAVRRGGSGGGRRVDGAAEEGATEGGATEDGGGSEGGRTEGGGGGADTARDDGGGGGSDRSGGGTYVGGGAGVGSGGGTSAGFAAPKRFRPWLTSGSRALGGGALDAGRGTTIDPDCEGRGMDAGGAKVSWDGARAVMRCAGCNNRACLRASAPHENRGFVGGVGSGGG